MKTHKCQDCGFLALRNYKTGELAEADIMYRKEGQQFRGDCLSLAPYCSVREIPIHQERLESSDGSIVELVGELPFLKSWTSNDIDIASPAILKNITKTRNCKKWMPWHEGFTPKEHREMYIEDVRHRWQMINNWIMAAIAFLALIVAAVSIVTAFKTTKMQIDANERRQTPNLTEPQSHLNPTHDPQPPPPSQALP